MYSFIHSSHLLIHSSHISSHLLIHSSHLFHRLLATGNNRLLVAVMEDDQTVISHLVLEEGVSVNTEFYHNGYTALHQACEEGYDDITQLLIELGADINKKV